MPSLRTAVLFFLISAALPLQAATFHAIVICDTKAKEIRASVEKDLNAVRKEAQQTANYIGFNLHEHLYIGNEVTRKILKIPNSLEVNEEDIILFYFSGHGYRTASKKNNQWPNFYLTKENRGIDFQHIAQLLDNQKPRLLIIIADCCNNILPDSWAPPLIKTVLPAAEYKAAVSNNYRQLFLENEGTIYLSSSAPGEYSWASKQGGIYTLALIHSIQKEVAAKRTPSWEAIAERAAIKVIKSDFGQTPISEIRLKKSQ